MMKNPLGLFSIILLILIMALKRDFLVGYYQK